MGEGRDLTRNRTCLWGDATQLLGEPQLHPAPSLCLITYKHHRSQAFLAALLLFWLLAARITQAVEKPSSADLGPLPYSPRLPPE